MRRFTLQDFQFLLEYTNPSSISFYLPVDNVSINVHKRDVAYKDLIHDAVQQLNQLNLTHQEFRRIVKKMESMIDTDEFWQQGIKGLAIFIAPDAERIYQLPIDVPYLATVSYRFQLQPIIPLITQPCDFYLLSLSKKKVELFKGDCYGLKSEHVPDLPESIEEATGVETGERNLQFHTSTTSPGGGKRPAMYHGSSSWKDDKHKYLALYLQRTDTAVEKYLRRSKVPLILTGVERMKTLYNKVNTYSHFLPDLIIKGNTENLSLLDLHQRALQLMQPYFREQEKQIITKCFEHGPGEKISTNLSEIIREAQQGRVDTVVVAQNIRQWGMFDPENLEVRTVAQPEPRSHDLLDLACAQTLLNGGKAYILPPEEIPHNQSIAAFFRY
jgi:hypothetical protein